MRDRSSSGSAVFVERKKSNCFENWEIRLLLTGEIMSKNAEKIRRKTVNAIADYGMLREGDRVLVAVSGGIDSSVLLLILLEIQRRAPFSFSLHPMIVEQGFPGMEFSPFYDWIKSLQVELEILSFNTYNLLSDTINTGNSPCQICSRLRRGIIYTYVEKQGYTKVALGHNRDDLNETFLMNLFYTGRSASMPPKLRIKDSDNSLIRPLCYTPKDMIVAYGKELEIPIVKNPFCDALPNNSRASIKGMLKELELQNPKIPGSLLTAQKTIIPSQLADPELWDFSW